jgi:hypothetical protein
MTDPRLASSGLPIPAITYADQPYLVATDDGAWLCVLCSGAGHEGQQGQTVLSLRSTDQGRSWSEPLPIEPVDGPEASYAVLLKAPSGRIFVFYNHNTDRVARVPADPRAFPDGWCQRVDSLGHFVFRYSDDHGRSWSQERIDIPQRLFAIDRENADQGRLFYFWNVGRAFSHGGTAFVPLHKVGGFGLGFFTRSEGVLLASDDLLTSADPATAAWRTLPEGEVGLRTPPGGGPIAEEQSCVVLSDGTFFCVYRTIDGHPACCRSRDQGRTWSVPDHLRYADGRPVKHPRAANFLWRCRNGKYLYWYHNHGGAALRRHPRRATYAYEHRNPVWLAGAVEIDTPEGRSLRLGQGEVLLYDPDPLIRMSYPDLIESDDGGWVSETDKHHARLHRLDPVLLDGLWAQLEDRWGEDVRETLWVDWRAAVPPERQTPAPRHAPFLERDPGRADHGSRRTAGGFTIHLHLTSAVLTPGAVLYDSRDDEGLGTWLRLTDRGSIELVMRDHGTTCLHETEHGVLNDGREHQLTLMVDSGPGLILAVRDGRLEDGGDQRQFGWSRFSPQATGHGGGGTLTIGEGVQTLRVYGRALRVFEALAVQRHLSRPMTPV